MADRRGELVEPAWRLGQMRGRTARDVMLAVLSSKTLRMHGHEGGDCLTDEQVEVAIALVTAWIERTVQ